MTGPVIRRKRFRTPTAVKRAQTAVSKDSSGILLTLTDKNMDGNSETSLQCVANEKNCSTSKNDNAEMETQARIDGNTKEDDKKLVNDGLKEKATGKGRPIIECSSVKTESSMRTTDNKNEGGTNNSNKRTNLVDENEKLPDCFKNKTGENRCWEVTNNFGSDKECLTGGSGKDSIVDYTPTSKDSVIGKESLTGKRKKKDVRKTIFLQNLPEGKTSFVNNRQKNRHSKNGKKSPKNSAVDRLKHFNNNRVAAHRNPSPKYSTTSNSAENSLRDSRNVNGSQNMENGRKANAIAEEVVGRNCFYRFMRIDESSSQSRTSLPRGRDTKMLEANRTAKRTLIKNDNSNSSDDVTKGKRALEGTSNVSSPSKRRCFDCKNTGGFDKMNPKKDMNTTFKAAGLVVSPPKDNYSDAKSTDNSDQFASKKDISTSFRASGLVVSPPKKNNGSDSRNTENSEKFDSKKVIGTAFKAAGLLVAPPKRNCLDFKNTENSEKFDSKKVIGTAFKTAGLADAPSKNNCSDSTSAESADKFGLKKEIGGSYKAADVVVVPLKNQEDLKSKQSPIKSNSQKNIPTTDKATDIIVAPSKSKYSADNLASKNNVGITFIPDGLLVVPPNNKFSDAKTTESLDKSCSKKNSGTTFKGTGLDALPNKSKTIDTTCTENSKNLEPKKNIAFDLKVLIERCKSTDSKSRKISDSLSLKKEVASDAKVLKQKIINTGAPNNIAPKDVDTPSQFRETDATVTATGPVVAPPIGKCQNNNDKRDPKATVGPSELRNASVEKDTRESDGDTKEDGSDGMSVSQDKNGKESSMENPTGKLNNPDKGNVKDSSTQLEVHGLSMTTHSVKDVVQKIGHGSNFDKVYEVSVLPKNSESTENLSMQNKLRKQEMKSSETKEIKLSVGDTTLKINDDKSGETAQLEEDAFKTTDVITNSTNNSEKKKPATTSCKQHYQNKSLTREGGLGDMLVSNKFSIQKKQENDGLAVTKDASEHDCQKINGGTNFDVAELTVDAIDGSSPDKERVVEKQSKVDSQRDDRSLQKDLCSKRPISSCTSVPLTNVPTENSNGSVMKHSFSTDIMDGSKANNNNAQKINQVRSPVKGDLPEKSSGFSSIENGNRGLNKSLPVPTIPDKISVEDDHENRIVLENEEQLTTISENNSFKTNNLNREGVGNVLEIEVKPETVLNTVPVGNDQFKFSFTVPAEERSLNGQTDVSESKHGSLTSNGQKTTKILRNTDVATSEIRLCESKWENVNKTIVTYVENENGELIMSEQFIHQKTNFDRKNTDSTSEHLQKITSSTKSSTIYDDEYSKKSPRSENASAMQVSQEVKKESNLGEIFSKDYSPDIKRIVEDMNERETFSNSLFASDLPKNNTSYGHNTSSIVKIYESNISKDTQLHNDQSMAAMTRNKSNGSESSLEIRNTGSEIEDVQKVKLENMSPQRRNTDFGIEQGAKVKIEKMPPPKANSEEKEKINSNSVNSTIVSDVERTQNLSKPIKFANTGRSPAFFPHFALMDRVHPRNRVQEEPVWLARRSRQDLLGISQKPVDVFTETSGSIRKNPFSGSVPMYSNLYADYEHLSLPGPSHTSLQNHAQNKSQLSGVNAYYNMQENGAEKRKKSRQQKGKNGRKKRLRRETQNQQAIQQKECNVQNGKGLGGNGNAQQKFKPGSLKETAVKVNVGLKDRGGSCTHSSQSFKNFLHPSSQSESNNTKGGRQRGKDLSQNAIGQIMNKTNVGTLNPAVQDPRHGSNIAVDKYFSQSLNHLSASFQESLHSASLSRNLDHTNGGTTVGIGGPNDYSDTALVGKRKRNDELAVLDGNKRQKCQNLNKKSVRQSNDQLASVSNEVESISLRERREEAERQKQENDFVLKKIKQIQKVGCTFFL